MEEERRKRERERERRRERRAESSVCMYYNSSKYKG